VADLLPLVALPAGFVYPKEFVRVVELGLTNLEPWWILQGEQLHQRYLGLAQRFPDRTLVPFARRQDNDDVACWEVDPAGRAAVVVVHDFASPGWEDRGSHPDFYSWLRQAVDDLIAFD
jgi:hypothetical protein